MGTEAGSTGSGQAEAVAFLDFDQELLSLRYRAAEEAIGMLVRAGRLVQRAATGWDARGGGGPPRPGARCRPCTPEHPVLVAAHQADPGRWSRPRCRCARPRPAADHGHGRGLWCRRLRSTSRRWAAGRHRACRVRSTAPGASRARPRPAPVRRAGRGATAAWAPADRGRPAPDLASGALARVDGRWPTDTVTAGPARTTRSPRSCMPTSRPACDAWSPRKWCRRCVRQPRAERAVGRRR